MNPAATPITELGGWGLSTARESRDERRAADAHLEWCRCALGPDGVAVYVGTSQTPWGPVWCYRSWNGAWVDLWSHKRTAASFRIRARGPIPWPFIHGKDGPIF